MSENGKEKERYMMYPVAPPLDVVYRNATAPYPVGPHSHNAAELYRFVYRGRGGKLGVCDRHGNKARTLNGLGREIMFY